MRHFLIFFIFATQSLFASVPLEEISGPAPVACIALLSVKTIHDPDVLKIKTQNIIDGPDLINFLEEWEQSSDDTLKAIRDMFIKEETKIIRLGEKTKGITNLANLTSPAVVFVDPFSGVILTGITTFVNVSLHRVVRTSKEDLASFLSRKTFRTVARDFKLEAMHSGSMSRDKTYTFDWQFETKDYEKVLPKDFPPGRYRVMGEIQFLAGENPSITVTQHWQRASDHR